MARYRDLHTAAQNYGSVYRQGLAQRESSRKDAGDQMLSFAGDIYDLVERQKQREAAEAESAALERQRKAQRRLWEHQAQADDKRLGLEGKRLGLEGSRVSLQGKQVDIQAAQHLHRKSHDEKTLTQRGVEAKDLKLYRKRQADQKEKDSKFKQFEFRFNKIKDQYKDHLLRKGQAKWFHGSQALTDAQYKVDSKELRDRIADAMAMEDPTAKMSNLKSILTQYSTLFHDPMSADQIKTLSQVKDPELLNKHLKLASLDTYRKRWINKDYEPDKFTPQGDIMRSHLLTMLTHPEWGPVSKEDIKLQKAIFGSLEPPIESGVKSSVKSVDEKKNEPFLETNEVPSNIENPLVSEGDSFLNTSIEPISGGNLVLSNEADRELFNKEFLQKNKYFVTLTDDQQKAVLLMVQAGDLAKPNENLSLETSLNKFNEFSTFKDHMSKSPPDTAKAFNSWVKWSTAQSLIKSDRAGYPEFVAQIKSLLVGSPTGNKAPARISQEQNTEPKKLEVRYLTENKMLGDNQNISSVGSILNPAKMWYESVMDYLHNSSKGEGPHGFGTKWQLKK